MAGGVVSVVGRIWRAHGLKPHRVKTFKLSNDPRFAEKPTTSSDLNPPEHALVPRSMRSPKSKPSIAPNPACRKKGRGQTMTHDYKRNGTSAQHS